MCVSVSLCVYVCVCTSVRVNIYVCVRMCLYMCVCMYVYVCEYVCVSLCVLYLSLSLTGPPSGTYLTCGADWGRGAPLPPSGVVSVGPSTKPHTRLASCLKVADGFRSPAHKNLFGGLGTLLHLTSRAPTTTSL